MKSKYRPGVRSLALTPERALPRDVLNLLGLRVDPMYSSVSRPKGAVYPQGLGRRSYSHISAQSRLLQRRERARVTPAKPFRRLVSPVMNRLRAVVPVRIKFCLMRKVRREVMFARSVAGRRGIRRYRRTVESSYSCR